MHNDNRLDILSFEITAVVKALVDCNDYEKKLMLTKRLNRLKQEKFELQRSEHNE